MDLIDFGMNPQEAGDVPRIYHQGTRTQTGYSEDVGDTFVESGFFYEVLRDLINKGHKLHMNTGIFGGCPAIMVKDGILYCATESRKDGQAAEY